MKSKKENLLNNEMVIIKVVSGSMKPSINKNDIVLVKKDSKIFIGDIVAFYKKDGQQTIPLLHRVVKVTSQKIFTSADINLKWDKQSINKSLVVGKVIKIKLNNSWIYLNDTIYLKTINKLIAISSIFGEKIPNSSFLKRLKYHLSITSRNMISLKQKKTNNINNNK